MILPNALPVVPEVLRIQGLKLHRSDALYVGLLIPAPELSQAAGGDGPVDGRIYKQLTAGGPIGSSSARHHLIHYANQIHLPIHLIENKDRTELLGREAPGEPFSFSHEDREDRKDTIGRAQVDLVDHPGLPSDALGLTHVVVGVPALHLLVKVRYGRPYL